MCYNIGVCCSKMFERLPDLETPAQKADGKFSTTRKVISCLPIIGLYMAMHNLDPITTTNAEGKNKWISSVRYLLTSTLTKLALIVSAVALSKFHVACLFVPFFVASMLNMYQYCQFIQLKHLVDCSQGA